MDNEIWKSVKGYEGLYEVSNFGRMKSLSKKVRNGANSYCVRKEIILTGTISNKGYVKVILVKDGQKQQYSVHRIVMMMFVPNPNNMPQVNHLDTNKQNNAVSNLEWCDGSRNMKHACKNGLRDFLKGETHPTAKLSTKEVLEIRRIWDTNMVKIHEIAEIFNITYANAQSIVKRHSWKHI